MLASIGPSTRRAWRVHAAAAAASVLSLGWYFYLGYGATLAPTHFEWMLRQDWAANFWGLAFFRNSAWSFPLGATPELIWPYGTSIGFTDANPWLSVWLKLWSPLLPLRFQPFGFWYLLCFVLQAWFGAKLTGTLTSDRAQQVLGGLLFALTPVIPARHGHITLCGLFFVTAGLYLCLRPAASRGRAKALLGGAALLLLWAAGTHPYLSIMALVLVLACCVRLTWHDRLLSPRELVLVAIGASALTFGTFWVFGYIGWGEHLRATGFGKYSADLATLVNPQHWSRWVPTLGYQPQQHEGFGYLGVGVLALLVLRIALLVRDPGSAASALRRHWPLVLVLCAMALFALSSKVRFLGHELLDLRPVYAPFSQLTEIFRSSGRFIWPLHVALIAAAVSACAALRNPWLARALLLGAIALQGAELERGWLDFRPAPLARLKHPAWASVKDEYRHMELTPAHLRWVCRYDERLVNRVAYEAYRRRLTFNSGNVARRDLRARDACRRKLDAPIEPDAQTIYVVDPTHRRLFREHAACGKLDGLLICASPKRETRLLSALRRNPA